MKNIAVAALVIVFGCVPVLQAEDTPTAPRPRHFTRATRPGTTSGPGPYAAGPRATGPTFIPIFDASINSNPRAADIKATITAALQQYTDKFSDPVTVTITFKNVTDGLGASLTSTLPFKYADVRAALLARATSDDDKAAVATIPAGANNPVNNDPNVTLTTPLARVLGFTANPTDGVDSEISLNMAEMNITAADNDKNKYSLMSTAQHEIDEVLGTGSGLDDHKKDPLPISGPIYPEDLFRYDKAGARSFTNVKSAESFFSIDGKTNLAQFNQDQSGDFGDWFSPGTQTPQVQDAFGAPGTNEVLGVEIRVLDVLGWTLTGNAVAGTGGNKPPVIGSAASYSPNPAPVGTAVTLTVGATDPDNDTISVAWDFGDSTKGAGASTTHTYNATGSFTATATVTDGKGGSVTSSVTVNVVTAVFKADMIKQKFSLNFKTGNDGIDVTLSADAFADLLDDDTVSLAVGDAKPVTVDSGTLFKNKAAGSVGKFTVNLKKATVRYAATRTQLQDALAPFGAVNDTVNSTVTIPIYIVINGKYYGDKFDFAYKAKVDKSGAGK